MLQIHWWEHQAGRETSAHEPLKISLALHVGSSQQSIHTFQRMHPAVPWTSGHIQEVDNRCYSRGRDSQAGLGLQAFSPLQDHWRRPQGSAFAGWTASFCSEEWSCGHVACCTFLILLKYSWEFGSEAALSSYNDIVGTGKVEFSIKVIVLWGTPAFQPVPTDQPRAQTLSHAAWPASPHTPSFLATARENFLCVQSHRHA